MLMIKSRTPRKVIYMLKKTLVMLGTCVVLMFVISTGCETRKTVSRETAKPGDLAKKYNIEMTLTHLPDEVLIERFGARNNPFIAPRSLMGINDFFVFEVVVQNNTDPDVAEDASIIVLLKGIRLLYGGRSIAPLNQFKLSDIWDNEGRHAHGREYDISKMKYTVKRYVFQNTLKIPPGDTYNRIIVFMGRFPAYGEGNVHIPVMTADKELIGIFHDEFTF